MLTVQPNFLKSPFEYTPSLEFNFRECITPQKSGFRVCCGLTLVGSSAARSCSLALPTVGQGESQKGKSEKTRGLR